MDGGVDTTIFAAFGVGLLSFFSPCVLPLVPGYLSAISGAAPAEAEVQEGDARRMLGPALLFVLSFTTIFMALGLTATGLGKALTDNIQLLQTISGVAIIALGVFLLASLVIPQVNREWRMDSLAERAGTGGPIIAGAAFAIAWTPCVGPTLGAILTAAGTKQHLGEGAVLLLFYSAGLAVPFLLSALGVGAMTGATGWVKRHYPVLVGFSSVILIAVGVMILTDEFYRLNVEAQRLTQSLGLDL
ncbi:MAG: cytochrome c biogenesis protein CcdA [Actinobacteria bacterium]|nr:cytochrome c biogenesis protein CcdA [Actinomycetota bacterium]